MTCLVEQDYTENNERKFNAQKRPTDADEQGDAHGKQEPLHALRRGAIFRKLGDIRQKPET